LSSKLETMNEPRGDLAEIATFLGMVSQLYTTRMEALFNTQGFTLSQFALLSHLARSSKAVHTISDLTEAMEINQPGVSKIVQKLYEQGYLEVNTNKFDTRKREVRITTQGRSKLGQVGKAIYPDLAIWFKDWQEGDKQSFANYLRRLAQWLDKNRLEK
jgi:DNA-binding MarR family transcriptional regulator